MPRRAYFDEGFNNTGSTIAANLIVSGGPSSVAVAAGATTVPYGVTARAIADQAMGDVQTEGWAIVLAGAAGMTEGTLVMPEAGGTGCGVDLSGSSGNARAVLGLCVQAATSGNLGLVKLGVHLTQVA